MLFHGKTLTSQHIKQYKSGSSGKWSDKVCIEQKKIAEHFVYLNNDNQIYKNEQQLSISCLGALQP